MNAYEKNILGFAEQLSPKGLFLHRLNALRASRPDGVIICGMGGSGLAGEIIQTLAAELRLKAPVMLSKDYGVPKHPFRRPLFIFVSFSGNTEETLSGLAKAGRGSRAIVASGGKLLAYAEQKNLPAVSFAAGVLTPRQSVGRMFYALVEILHAAGLMPRAASMTGIRPGTFRAAGKRLAAKLRNRLIMVYTDNAHRFIGYIWKIKFNETSKVHAFANVLPEMNHNELTAFDRAPKALRIPTAALFITDPRLSPRLAKRFRTTAGLLRKQGVAVLPLSLSGRTELEKAWRALLLADWTSYFLGKLNDIPEKEFNIVNPRIVIDLKRLMG